MQERASRRAFFGLAGRGTVGGALAALATGTGMARAATSTKHLHIGQTFTDQRIDLDGLYVDCVFTRCTFGEPAKGLRLLHCAFRYCTTLRLIAKADVHVKGCNFWPLHGQYAIHIAGYCPGTEIISSTFNLGSSTIIAQGDRAIPGCIGHSA